jgi:hypothetical protein
MLLARGDPTIFLTRPISAAFLVATVLFVVLMVCPVCAATSPPRPDPSLSGRPALERARGSSRQDVCL